MSRSAAATGSTRRKIVLLASQAFTLGLMTAWILIAASAIFIARFGSGMLPVTYIGAAIAGAASSTALSRTLRRRTLSTVASRVLVVLSVALLASCLALQAGAEWVSFALLVLVPIIVPVGFMLVVGQAGILLDVRAMKASYGRVIAGFATGFMTGGVAGPPLLRVFGETEQLLAAAAVVAAAFAALVVATRRNFPAELSVLESSVSTERLGLRGILRERYIAFIVAFQMLSAVESQWLDFLVYDHASERYQSSEALAQFFGRFTAIAYGVDIVFLVVLAGLLLRRHGLRYGLVANAGGVLAMLTAAIVASALFGSATTIVLVLIVSARVTDLVLSDGAARASLGAAYQAVPNRLRLVAQATVEGIGVPIAIGVSGLVLIFLRKTTGTSGLLLPILTTAVVIVWAVVAALVYRRYATELLAGLRHRLLDPDIDELATDEVGGAVVIDRLLESDDERDVRLGLEMVERSSHGDMVEIMSRFAYDERPSVHVEALARLMEVDRQAARVAARAELERASAPSSRTLARRVPRSLPQTSNTRPPCCEASLRSTTFVGAQSCATLSTTSCGSYVDAFWRPSPSSTARRR